MRMNCFGDKVSSSGSFHCKIVLLDEQQLVHEILMSTTGQDVLNVVYQHLGAPSNLLETAYFGLRYLDSTHQPQWLDPNKKVLQQLKGAGSQSLYFAVKFYAVDPCKLVFELTRYQFFLQIKKDVLQGRLPVSTELAAELAALALQSELGDYDPGRYKPGYVSEFRFLAHQSPDLETKIAELHKTMRGLVPAVAEMRYLDRVKWLDLYGVDLHPVLGEDTVEYFLGLTPSGIIVLRNKTKVGNYFWPRISKIQFKGRYFMLRVRDKSNDESTFGFETPSKGACKSLYKCCSQHLAFFRLVQMSGPTLNLNGNSTTGPPNNNNNNKFLKLAGVGPTATDLIDPSQPGTQPFRRMPSRRHQRRIGDGASHPPQVDECSTSDSDKTLDAASTAALLSPYHSSKTTEAPQRPSDTWTEASSIRSRRTRSHSRSRKERRSSSVDSTESRSHHHHNNRRRSHRSRSSRHNSDNESEVSRASETSRGGSRRRRHRSTRDSSGSESESSQHRSNRRHRRRDSQGSSYELVDSEAQWREIQERQQLQQTATVRPAAASTPTTSVPVQQATVRKASNAVNVSMSSSVNDSLLDQSDVLNSVETSSHVSSGGRQHRQHRKHHHRHHRHRSHSRNNSDKNGQDKPSLPSEIRPHLQFQLVDPPTGSTADQLREIPYQVVNSGPSALVLNGNEIKRDSSAQQQSTIQQQPESLSRKRHRGLHPSTFQPDDQRKIISVDNDSPPPPYSPPQNGDSLSQTLATLSVSKVAAAAAAQQSNNHPQITVTNRPPLAPIPGPKPNRSSLMGMRTNSATPYNGTSTSSSSGSTVITGSSGHERHHQSNGFYNQYPVNNNNNSGKAVTSSNGFHYAYPAPPNPHQVGLPPVGFMSNNSSSSITLCNVVPPPRQHGGQQPIQPRAPSSAVATTTTASGTTTSSSLMMPLSPLASGVTVTQASDTTLLRSSIRQHNSQQQQQTTTTTTKYVTRPQTPVTLNHNNNFTLTTMTLPAPSSSSRRKSENTKFSIQPPPSLPDPAYYGQSSTLPRLVQHLPAPAHRQNPQTANPGNASYYYPQQTMTMMRRRVAAEVADPSASDGSKPPRRASSLELILSPMVESTLQRRKRAI